MSPGSSPHSLGSSGCSPLSEVAAEFHPTLQIKEKSLRMEYWSLCHPVRNDQGKYLKLRVLCPHYSKTRSLSDDWEACHAESCLSLLPGSHPNSERQSQGFQGTPAGRVNTHDLCAQRDQAPACQLGCIMEEKRDSS